jgi:hypothetical protein
VVAGGESPMAHPTAPGQAPAEPPARFANVGNGFQDDCAGSAGSPSQRSGDPAKAYTAGGVRTVSMRYTVALAV